MLHVSQQVFGCTLFDNFAVAHDDDPVGHAGNDSKIVGNHHQAHTVLSRQLL